MLALAFLSFNLGLVFPLFLSALPQVQSEPTKVVESVVPKSVSIDELRRIVDSSPKGDLRACLEIVLGTAYVDRCHELLQHSQPFVENLLQELSQGEEQHPDSQNPDAPSI